MTRDASNSAIDLLRRMLMATDDNDVEIISINGRPAEFNCEICCASLTTKSVSERQAHYEEHFNQPADDDQCFDEPERHFVMVNSGVEQSQIIDLSSSGDSMRGGGLLTNLKSRRSEKEVDKSLTPSNDKQNIFWYASRDSLPPPNFTPGLISVLRQALLTSHAKGRTIRAALCHESTVHVGSERWDMGWGCGYRNFLMACTALMSQQLQPLYFPVLDQPPPPGVRNLQYWIEEAWQKGFDPEGAKDLKKLIGTTKWIGTAEVHTAFLSRGIPSRLVDFTNKDSCALAVLKWVVDYFSEPSQDARTMRSKAKMKTTIEEALRGASPVVVTDRMPLILQHKGHSRTIVGYEKIKDGSINLLCFDPSRRPSSLIRNAALEYFFSSRTRQNPPQTSQARIESKHNHNISPSKIVNSVLHAGKHKERETSGSPLSKKRESEENVLRDSKRPRGGSRSLESSPATNREVIEISDEEDHIVQPEQPPQTPNVTHAGKTLLRDVDYAKVLDSFRLRPKKVGQNDRYQILYFPLEDLLTEEERRARRIVTSDVVP